MLLFQRRTSMTDWFPACPSSLHRVDVIAEDRIIQRRDELLVVVIVAEKAVAVGIGPDPDLRFPEAVRRAVLAHLPDRDFAGAVGEHFVALLLRGVDRRAMREPRVRGVAEIFEIELPVAVIGMLEDAAGDLDLAVGRAIDHIVERVVMKPSQFFEARSLSAPRLAKIKPR